MNEDRPDARCAAQLSVPFRALALSSLAVLSLTEACAPSTSSAPPALETVPLYDDSMMPALGTNVTLAPAAVDPERFIGLSPADVRGLLGPASLVRWEGTAQVAQFAGASCILDVFFYEQQPGAGYVSRYLAARGRDGDGVDKGVCLGALLPPGALADAVPRETP